MIILLKDVRIAFPVLWNAKGVVDRKTGKMSEPAFSATFLVSKTHPQLEELLEIMKAVAQAKWTGIDRETGRPEWELVLSDLMATDRIVLHDGNRKKYEGYANHWYVSARNAHPPLVVNRDPFIRDADGKPVMDGMNGPLPNLVTERSGIIYSGCYVNANIDIWAQDNSFGQRICASLKGVQFKRNGDAFVGGPPATPDSMEAPDLPPEAMEGAADAYNHAQAARGRAEQPYQGTIGQRHQDDTVHAQRQQPPAAPDFRQQFMERARGGAPAGDPLASLRPGGGTVPNVGGRRDLKDLL